MRMTLLRCSVDASRAGQGPLIIDITYNGQLIPAHIAQDPHRDKQFNVKFKPRGAGYYTRSNILLRRRNHRYFYAYLRVFRSPRRSGAVLRLYFSLFTEKKFEII